ncbi:MAG: UDP binding domain-containing protein, partial [Lutibacter sp.]
CFPRDCKAFYKMGDRLGLELPLQKVNDVFNKDHNSYVVKDAMKGLSKDATTVALLGVSFKPNTPIITESPAIQMAKVLDTFGYNVKAYDPQGKMGKVKMCESIEECLSGSDLAIIVTPWNQFKALKPNDFKIMRNPYVYDCWRLLNRRCFENSGVKYKALGVND